MKLRYILFAISLLLFIFSCKKDNGEDLNQKMILNDLAVGDNNIVLTWSKVKSNHFKQYIVARVDHWKEIYGSSYHYDTIAIIKDQNTTTFKDINLAESPEVQYRILAYFDNGNYAFSNDQIFKHSKFEFFKIAPFDIIHNVKKHRLYFFENSNGTITSYDYINRVVISKIKLDTSIVYSYLYDDGLVSRLIVPTLDNRLLFLNESDLKTIDSLNIGSGCYSVVINDSKVFVGKFNNFSYQIFDLNTHKLINAIGNGSNNRLFLVPNSGTDILSVTTDQIPPSIYKVHFDNDGKYSFLNSSKFDQAIDNLIFRIFPDGKHLITSEKGAIFSTSLTFIAQLPLPSEYYLFSDFCITDGCNKIYAAGSRDKSILEYSFPSININKIYPTIGFPFKIFIDNDYLIVVSNRDQTYYYNGNLTNIFSSFDDEYKDFIIERIKIK